MFTTRNYLLLGGLSSLCPSTNDCVKALLISPPKEDNLFPDWSCLLVSYPPMLQTSSPLHLPLLVLTQPDIAAVLSKSTMFIRFSICFPLLLLTELLVYHSSRCLLHNFLKNCIGTQFTNLSNLSSVSPILKITLQALSPPPLKPRISQRRRKQMQIFQSPWNNSKLMFSLVR